MRPSLATHFSIVIFHDSRSSCATADSESNNCVSRFGSAVMTSTNGTQAQQPAANASCISSEAPHYGQIHKSVQLKNVDHLAQQQPACDNSTAALKVSAYGDDVSPLGLPGGSAVTTIDSANSHSMLEVSKPCVPRAAFTTRVPSKKVLDLSDECIRSTGARPTGGFSSSSSHHRSVTQVG